MDIIGNGILRQLIIFCVQVLFLLFLVYYGIGFPGNLKFFVNLLVNFVIGGLVCHGILINIVIFRGVGKYFTSTFKKFYNDSPGSGWTLYVDSSCTKNQNASHEPWDNLMLDYRLDDAIQKFFDTVLNNFVMEWYTLHSNNKEFVDNIRIVLKYSSSILYKRAQSIHYGKLITRKLVPCGLHHFHTFYNVKRNSKENQTIEESVLESPVVEKLHPAVSSRDSELQHLRNITTAIMPLLLRPHDLESVLFQTLTREIFAGWVLLPLLDFLADPNTINEFLVLLTDREEMTKINTDSSEKVEFLHKFVNDDPKDYNNKHLQLGLQEILHEPKYLSAFTQFMKTKSKVHILQFCLDVDEFNEKLFNPDVNEVEQIALFKKAVEIYNTYFKVDSNLALNFTDELVMGMQDILKGGSKNVTQLQTCQALFEAYECAYTLLEDVWTPKFCYSKEFYSVLITPNTATSEPSLCDDSPTSVATFRTKLKDLLKTQSLLDNMGLHISDDFKMYLESILEDDSNSDIDYIKLLEKFVDSTNAPRKGLASWTVTIQKMYHSQDYTYLLYIQSSSEGDWMVERKENDFYMLQAKLIELHGEQYLDGLNLPPRRAVIPKNRKKIQFEEFLQNVIQKQSSHPSHFVFLFLTSDYDFTLVVEQENLSDSESMNINNIQSATASQIKEKSEFLTPFLNDCLKPTDSDDESSKDEDKKEDEPIEIKLTEDNLFSHLRIITNGIFQNNFNIIKDDYKNSQTELDRSLPKENLIEGFCDCVSFLATLVFKPPKYLRSIIWRILQGLKGVLDPAVENYLKRILREIFCQPRLAHWITLGHDTLFTSKSLSNKTKHKDWRLKAKDQIHDYIPNFIISLMGESLLLHIDDALEILQSPQLNKQLVLSLFDLVVMELFPEVQQEVQQKLQQKEQPEVQQKLQQKEQPEVQRDLQLELQKDNN